MSTVWDRFDGIVNAEEVVEARAKFEPIDAGEYTARLEKLAPSESKGGLPMLKGQFRTEENKVIFYNQMLQNLNFPNMTAVNVAEAVTFVSAITGEDIEFEGLAKLAEVVQGIEAGKVYTIVVKYGAKDLERSFPKISVKGLALEVPFADGFEPVVITEDDLPY